MAEQSFRSRHTAYTNGDGTELSLGAAQRTFIEKCVDNVASIVGIPLDCGVVHPERADKHTIVATLWHSEQPSMRGTVRVGIVSVLQPAARVYGMGNMMFPLHKYQSVLPHPELVNESDLNDKLAAIPMPFAYVLSPTLSWDEMQKTRPWHDVRVNALTNLGLRQG